MTARRKKPPPVDSTITVLAEVRKQEPQRSIAMGWGGPAGTYAGVAFTSTVDLGGRGLLVSYKKPDGTAGGYAIDVLPIIRAVIDKDVSRGES